MSGQQEILIINQVVRMALLVNGATDHTVFFKFSGHVDSFELKVYENGWKRGGEPDYEFDANNHGAKLQVLEAMLTYLSNLYEKEVRKVR